MVTMGQGWHAGVPGIYVVILQDVVADMGLDARALLSGFQIERDELLAPDCRVSAALARTAAERAVAMTEGRGLGFRYAQAMGITLHGSLGLLALSSANASDALEAACRYLRLRAPFLSIERHSRGDVEEVRFHALVTQAAVKDFVLEAVLTGLAFMVEQLLGVAPTGLEILRRGKAPAYRNELRAAVSVPVHFEQVMDGLVFPRSALQARPRLADPQMAALAREQCEREFRQCQGSEEGEMPERIRSALQDRPAPLPTLEVMADSMAVSARTLKRHLQQAGLTYRQLQEQELYRQARRRLMQSTQSISEVAYALGYSDVANFSRAFKRWTGGKTPRQFRDEGRAG